MGNEKKVRRPNMPTDVENSQSGQTKPVKPPHSERLAQLETQLYDLMATVGKHGERINHLEDLIGSE